MLNPISVFMPVFNSDNFIDNSIKLSYQYLSKHFTDFELVIVNDNSSDSSQILIENLLPEFPKLVLFNYEFGPTRRENLAQCMLNARFSVVMYMDADLSVPLNYIEKIVAEFYNKNADIVIGSRYKNIAPSRSLYRYLLSRIFNKALNLLYSSTVSDHIIGFKCFNRDKLNVLVAKLGFDTSLIRGWFWDAELLILAQKLGLNIQEIPVEWNAGNESTFSFYRESKILYYLISNIGKRLNFNN